MEPHLTENEIIEGRAVHCIVLLMFVGMNLDYITTNSWVVLMTSALKGTNIPAVVEWLIKKSKAKE